MLDGSRGSSSFVECSMELCRLFELMGRMSSERGLWSISRTSYDHNKICSAGIRFVVDRQVRRLSYRFIRVVVECSNDCRFESS